MKITQKFVEKFDSMYIQRKLIPEIELFNTIILRWKGKQAFTTTHP